MTATPSPQSLRDEIAARARGLGFEAVGIADPEAPLIGEAGARLREFVAAGRHGEMGWMAARLDWRAAPRALWSEARSAIVLGANYGPAEDPLALLERPERGGVSVYARGDDYHDVLKGRAKELGGWLAAQSGAGVKVFVDTAPVMEKPLAEAAGLGWRGKHTNLVSRDYGSWLFLAVILSAAALPFDDPHGDRCGACRRCLDICPTDAFPAPYQLDARACVSYLTIEHKGPIPRRFRRPMGNRIYGCDDCLAVCPWNKFAKTAAEARLHARVELQAPMLADLAGLDEAGFRAVFAKSPVKRIGRERFLRNVMIAIGNSGDARLLPAVRARLDDASALIRGAAVWALSRLAEREAFARARAQAEPLETDAGVLEEWRG